MKLGKGGLGSGEEGQDQDKDTQCHQFCSCKRQEKKKGNKQIRTRKEKKILTCCLQKMRYENWLIEKKNVEPPDT